MIDANEYIYGATMATALLHVKFYSFDPFTIECQVFDMLLVSAML